MADDSEDSEREGPFPCHQNPRLDATLAASTQKGSTRAVFAIGSHSLLRRIRGSKLESLGWDDTVEHGDIFNNVLKRERARTAHELSRKSAIFVGRVCGEQLVQVLAFRHHTREVVALNQPPERMVGLCNPQRDRPRSVACGELRANCIANVLVTLQFEEQPAMSAARPA